MNSRDAIDADKHPDLLNPEEPEILPGTRFELTGVPFSADRKVEMFPPDPFDEARYREEQRARWVETLQRLLPALNREGFHIDYSRMPKCAPAAPLQTNNSTLLARLLESLKAARKLTRAEECLLILSDGKPHKTAEFQNAKTGSEGLRRIREWRKRGYRITRRKIEGSSQSEYTLEVTE